MEEIKNTEIKPTKTNTGLLRTSELQRTEKREVSKKDLKYMREKDRELFTGVFEFKECPGMPMKFFFRKYKEDPVETYELYDGQVYTIPLGVAKHLNNSGKCPVYEYIMNNGQEVPSTNARIARDRYRITKYTRRFGFQSMDFMDNVEYEIPEKKIILATSI